MAKRRWKWWDTSRRDPTAYMHVQHMVPNVSGNYETCRIPVTWGSGNTNLVNGYLVASDAFQKTDGTARLFAATKNRLVEVTSSGTTDRSAGAADYTTTAFWHGAQFGDLTIYASIDNALQSSSSGAFAAVAGSPPKAKYICTQSLAVALAYYNDGVNTYRDGVWISDIGSATTWTPASSNQAANFRLLQTPGEITGMAPFKGDILVFKANSLYRLSYVGNPIIWQSRLIDDHVGAASIGCICACDDVVVFGGLMGWYVYDGANLEQIAPGRGTERMQGATLIGGAKANFAVGGPYLAAYLNGTTFYWAEQGLALFHPDAQPGITAPIIAIQVKDGPGRGAFGAFAGVFSNAVSWVSMVCLVRGTSAALVAAGIGGGDTYNQSWPGIWGNISGTFTPYRLSGLFLVQSSSDAAFVQTSFLGDPSRKTFFRGLLPLLCYYVNSAIASINMYTAQKSNISDASMSGSGQSSGALDADGVWWTFTTASVSRLACFQINATANLEIEDFVLDMQDAGSR